MQITGSERWRIAQAAEAEYWQFARRDEVELLRILHEKAAGITWTTSRVPELTTIAGPWVEVGIGPLGIGCIHLLTTEGRKLIGIDPLPPVQAASTLSPALQSLARGCDSGGYQHIRARGENLSIGDKRAALVVCYNVLDHCDDPASVVREAARVLRVGGHYVLGCDVYSLAGRTKYRVRAWIARRARKQLSSIADLAHPHQFIASDLERLISTAGLEIVEINKRPWEGLRRLWSHSQRMLIVARKPKTAARPI